MKTVSAAHRRGTLPRLIIIGTVLTWVGSMAHASEFDGFTEPNRTVNVAALETGTVKSINVQEGQAVKRNDILARLDDDVYLASLAIADEAMNAQGQLKSVLAELELRQQRLRKLEALRTDGHARQEEVERARADVAIGEARVLSANELLQVKRLEHEKMKVQLARRIVRSPIDGVVNLIRKDVGEFVAPNDPYIVEIVELDPLLATFSIPSFEAIHLQKDQSLSVFLEDVGKFVAGTVDVVAPVTDAESGTIRVKVRIANSEGLFRCGERCTLRLKQPAQQKRRGK